MEKSKRLFIGTYIDPDIFEFIYDDIRDDFSHNSTGKWVEPENLHFTYFFLGDVDVSKVQPIKNALRPVLGSIDSELIFKGLNAFPNINRPKVLFANIINPDNSISLKHDEISTILSDFGFKPENRKFNPHLTFRRLKTYQQPDFKKAVSVYRNKEFGIMGNYRIDLIESKLTRSGPVYNIL